MLGGLAGLVGWLWSANLELLSGVLLADAAGLVVVAYVAISRRQIDTTTEVAALVVLAAVAGLGQLKLASGVIAITARLLVEKSGLHALIRRLDDAGFRFAVMAIVIQPLLPPGALRPVRRDPAETTLDPGSVLLGPELRGVRSTPRRRYEPRLPAGRRAWWTHLLHERNVVFCKSEPQRENPRNLWPWV
jgi:hypothetical protein